MMKITYFHRRPQDFHFSIEKLFETIRDELPSHIEKVIEECPYSSTGIKNRLKNLNFAKRKAGYINHITGDVHYLSLVLPKMNTINTYHDFTFLKAASPITRLILKYFWVKIPVKRSAIVTVISNTTKKELVEITNCPLDKIRVIPNIIPSTFTYFPKTFNSSTPEILHIGTTPNKNLERLAKALSKIKCKLHIVGKLNKNHFKSLRTNSIHYTNYVQIPEQDLVDLYRTIDMLSFCSLNEGFGMPILEAQATGRPVITSNLSSMPEVAGDAACLIDPYDADDIRLGILRIINDKKYRDNLIDKGLKNVERFQPKAVAAQYAAVYHEIDENNIQGQSLI